MPESLFLIKLQASNFIKKETLVHMFSCEFCENSKNTFFYRTLSVACLQSFVVSILLPYDFSDLDLHLFTTPQKYEIFPINIFGTNFD